MRLTAHFPVRPLVQRALTLTLAGTGLIWCLSVLPNSDTADDFRVLEGQLLRFETFSPTELNQALEQQASHDPGPCDTHSQRAMLLMELPMAASALRSGDVAEFDRRIQSLEKRVRRALSCAPRDSFAWLLAFDLAVLRGSLDEQAFGLLAMSYETSPNEAWISIRRIVVAMPLLLVAPEPVRQKILAEFQQLVRNGFTGDAARAYVEASPPIRALLETQIGRLDPARQKAFSNKLQALPPRGST